MKKKVFIAIHYLEIGGAEISLIGFLQALDYSRYDVDLFVYSHRGELMEFIPKEVNLLPEIPEYARDQTDELVPEQGRGTVLFLFFQGQQQENDHL